MNIIKFIEVNSDTKWSLKAKKNIYRQLHSGRVWNKFLVEKLTSSEFRFRQSKIDECMFYRGESMHILYTDDTIISGQNKEELRHILAEVKVEGLDITRDIYIEDLPGVNIDKVGSVLETCRAGTYEAIHSLCSHSSDHRLQAQYKVVRIQAIARTY